MTINKFNYSDFFWTVLCDLCDHEEQVDADRTCPTYADICAYLRDHEWEIEHGEDHLCPGCKEKADKQARAEVRS